MDLQLKGKVALITGASRGLGFATALALSREGADLVICSRNQHAINEAAEAIQTATGGSVLPVAADVTDHQAAERILTEVASRYDVLDVLITNAGGPPAGSFEKFDDTTWLQAVESSFLSHVRLIRAALPFLRRSASPAVLTMTSYSVLKPINNLVLSNSVRSATVSLSRSLAVELGSEGIRFNSILPGWILTDRVKNLMATQADFKGTSVTNELDDLVKDIPLKRIGQPDEFANAAVFLVSPAASYVTGVFLPVDGGASIGV